MNFIFSNRLIKISLIVLFMCGVLPNVFAQNIILKDSNNFIDLIEPNVTIYKTGETSPIFGRNLEFSCGKCSFAEFNDTTSKIGGGGKICGYGGGVPIKIVNNNDQLCVRSKISNNKYDINFITWVAHGKCTDNDEGNSCSIAENQFSYVRSKELTSKQQDNEISSKTNKDLTDIISPKKETSWFNKNFNIIILIIPLLGIIFLIILLRKKR